MCAPWNLSCHRQEQDPPNKARVVLFVAGTVLFSWWNLYETLAESRIHTTLSPLLNFHSIAASATFADTTTIPGLLLPHGDFALDPTLVDDFDDETRRAAYEVNLGSSLAAASFLESIQMSQKKETTVLTKSTTIILVTPHGSIQLDHDFGVYVARSASGTATIGQDLINHKAKKEYNVSISNLPLNFDASLRLLEFLQERNQSVSGIYPDNHSEDSSLRLNWGEIIPLKLLQQQHQRDQQDQQDQQPTMARTLQPKQQQQQEIIRYIILSMPHRRYHHAAEMVPELLKLGEWIGSWILVQQRQQSTDRFSVLISGDLSHTHQASGPYGYSPFSSAFDKAIGDWAMNPSSPCGGGNADSLLETARRLQSQALSCGYTGYVLWQGILQSQWKRVETIEADAPGEMITPRRAQRGLDDDEDDDNERPDNTKHGTVVVGNDVEYCQEQYQSLQSKVYVNRNVTYYGMIAATFLWEDKVS